MLENDRYQWIKGDDLGSVETINDASGKFLKFESGRKCNKEIMHEFMIQILDDSDILPLKDALDEEKIQIAIKANKRKVQTNGLDVATNVISKPVATNPIIPLLDKAKTSKVTTYMTFDLELPSKEFIGVLQDSWDEDILVILSKHLSDQIKDPKEFITEKIKVSLAEWFHTKSD